MPAGTASNVKLGPGLLYFGAVGTPEPATLAATLDSGWTAVGYTDAGSTFNLSQTWEGTSVAEEVLPILYGVTGAEYGISFDMAEITAANISKALNGGTIVTTGRLVGTGSVAAATTDVWTSTGAHHLNVGDAVVLGTITSIVSTPAVSAGPTYYVLSTPTSTTFTLSTTAGGTLIDVTTAGTTATVTESADTTTFEPPAAGTETRTAILWQSVTAVGPDEMWVFRKCIQTGSVAIPRQKSPNKATIAVQFQCEVPNGLQPFKAWFEAA